MKRLLLIVVVAAGLATVAAGGASAATTTQTQFRGENAIAQLSQREGCVETNAFVFANNGRAKYSGDPTYRESFASVSIFAIDSCSLSPLVSAVGAAALAPGEFVTQGRFGSASLHATVEAFDYLSGNTFPLRVDLEWSGRGDTIGTKYHTQSTGPGYRITTRFSGTWQQAEASGTVISPMAYVSGLSAWASLGETKSGVLEVIQS
jgi:hypothetical protein